MMMMMMIIMIMMMHDGSRIRIFGRENSGLMVKFEKEWLGLNTHTNPSPLSTNAQRKF